MTDYEYLKSEIEKGITEKLGDDIMDLNVAVGIHGSGRDFLSPEHKLTRIVARVWSTEITIIKPASKWDMIKLAMPHFIQRIFPPKTIEETHIVGLPGLKNVKKSKVASLIYMTDEMIDNPGLLINWCVNSGSGDLQFVYTDNKFRGW